MTIEECTERWGIQTEKIICRIENEFLLLNEKQLNYRIHVRHCNIREIMNCLYNSNARLLSEMDKSAPMAASNAGSREFVPGWAARVFLSHACPDHCRVNRRNGLHPPEGPPGNTVFSGLLAQENKLKDFISSGSTLDMNKKVVPFRLFGIVKLSLAETLEYMMGCQQSHITRARNLVKIQQ